MAKKGYGSLQLQAMMAQNAINQGNQQTLLQGIGGLSSGLYPFLHPQGIAERLAATKAAKAKEAMAGNALTGAERIAGGYQEPVDPDIFADVLGAQPGPAPFVPPAPPQSPMASPQNPLAGAVGMHAAKNGAMPPVFAPPLINLPASSADGLSPSSYGVMQSAGLVAPGAVGPSTPNPIPAAPTPSPTENLPGASRFFDERQRRLRAKTSGRLEWERRNAELMGKDPSGYTKDIYSIEGLPDPEVETEEYEASVGMVTDPTPEGAEAKARRLVTPGARADGLKHLNARREGREGATAKEAERKHELEKEGIKAKAGIEKATIAANARLATSLRKDDPTTVNADLAAIIAAGDNAAALMELNKSPMTIAGRKAMLQRLAALGTIGRQTYDDAAALSAKYESLANGLESQLFIMFPEARDSTFEEADFGDQKRLEAYRRHVERIADLRRKAHDALEGALALPAAPKTGTPAPIPKAPPNPSTPDEIPTAPETPPAAEPMNAATDPELKRLKAAGDRAAFEKYAREKGYIK